MNPFKDMSVMTVILSILYIANMYYEMYILNFIIFAILLYLLDKYNKDLANAKLNLSKFSGHYISKMTFEQFSLYMDTVITRTVIQSIREDIANPKNINMNERYKMIIKNSLVRYVDYFQEEIPYINQMYGDNYIIKHFNFFTDELMTSGNMTKLYDKYISR